MKKVIVVSKTHLDLGFTDYAENIRQKYINGFIPGAIELANKVNTKDEKNFVWTTGSWILKEALKESEGKEKEALINALKNGSIAPHALPFTTHTELFDEDTYEYGLSIVDELDKIRGRKTTAAKMTDVPGHTRGLVTLLARHGVKLLHIGVNGASAIPEVPECFLWKNGKDEVVVIYSGSYGGAFKSSCTEEVLYFDHALDNHGTPSPEKLTARLNQIKSEYPDYEVSAGTLDEFADVIWEKRHKLPVFDGEIGDSWIHGSAADPYKSASLRQLMALKRKWLADGSMTKKSEEYINLSDALLCIGEHTCGMDNKMYFADYENYLKKDFQLARKEDKVHLKHPLRDFPQNMITVINRKKGEWKSGSYSQIEKSWQEQRQYIEKGIEALSDEHKAQARMALCRLKGENIPMPREKYYGQAVRCGEWEMEINSFGGIGKLTCGSKQVIKQNDLPVVEYRSFSNDDYNYWLTHYSRDLEEMAKWAIGDFARLLLKYVSGKYPTGRFAYSMKNAAVKSVENAAEVHVKLECDEKLCEQLGAPKEFRLIYTLCEKGLKFTVSWFKKDASRLTEAIYLRLFPADGELKLYKLCDFVKPQEVVSKGSRNLHAVGKSRLETKDEAFDFINVHSPLISVGKGKILEFDNRFESMSKDGISYVLYDNVWGTNFPLWYEDDAMFEFIIAKSE